jgi:hypothetical protein
MADKQRPKLKAVEREARRLERLCKLRLVESPPPEKIAAPMDFDFQPKDAA